MGEEGAYAKIFEGTKTTLETETDTPESLSQNLRRILDSRPRDKNQWRTSFDEDVAEKSDIPKTRYSFNTFTAIDADVQLILTYIKEHNLRVDTTKIQNCRKKIYDGFYTEDEKYIQGINELREKSREITKIIIDSIPEKLKNKYSDQILWAVVQKGTLLMATEKLAQDNEEDMNINTEAQEGKSMMQIVKSEKARIHDIKMRYKSEVIQDLGEFHQRYVEQIIDPVVGAPVPDELVDELEHLVDITAEALNGVGESQQEEYQEAA